MSDGFDMGDALVGAMIFGPVLNPPTYSAPQRSHSGNSAEIADLRREIAMLRRELNVAFAILIKHGLVEMPAPEEPQGEA